MASAPIQSDLVLWQTLRTRRKRLRPLRGLDATVNRWVGRARHASKGKRFLRREAEAADALAGRMAGLTDDQLDDQIQETRQVFARRRHTTEHVRAAVAIVREVALRQTGQRPYLEQIMGTFGLFYGQIVEMVTGEGKTLAAAVAATMLAWLRKPVHIITVNDYLAQRDAEWNEAIYQRCGLSVGAVVNETPHPERADIYMRPLVYTTQKELVADWLGDQLRLGRITEPVSARWLAQGWDASRRGSSSQESPRMAPAIVPGLYTAIIDEVDAILIDEAVTPLIIAQPRGEDPQASLYKRAHELANHLMIDGDFTIDRARRRAGLTAAGQRQIESMFTADEHALWRASRRREELIERALAAKFCYHEGQHYQIVEDQVVIVDEYTGRYMHDRQWQHGLHQAVEVKHGLEVTADRDTLASMSFQRFFRQYPHLCGMTGTAADARSELETTYGLPVRVIPTHRPLKRKHLPSQVFVDTATKWMAVVEQIECMHRQHRPVLIGTRSIEASETLSGLLGKRHLPHQVLNAVHHRQEAEIIARAGEPGAITVATNMAGRGTDITLGPGVAERGGLYVILTERHTSRRIDRQFCGRAGRQGDPGSAQCILSLEDDLLIQSAPKCAAFLRRLAGSRRCHLPRWFHVAFNVAQRRAQRNAYRSRAAVVRHEDELEKALPR